MVTINVSRAKYLFILADLWTHVPRNRRGQVIFKAGKYRKPYAGR